MLLEKLRYKAEYATAPHSRDIKKPNEDRLLIDEERGIFILLDGITRVHSEYEHAPYSSAAGEVGDIFIKEVYARLCENINEPDIEQLMRSAVNAGNERIREYRKIKSLEEWGFYPATLGIIAIIRNNTLHYLSVGDSLCVLIRGSSKIVFGREFVLEAVDMLGVSKAERYEKYCNHPKNELSYTIFNGDYDVMNGVEYSFIDLHKGDLLLIGSDGIGSQLKYEKIGNLIMHSPDEIISLSDRYDRPPFAEYADDKTLIKLSF